MDVLKHKYHINSARARRIEELQKAGALTPRLRAHVRPETLAWITARREQSARMHQVREQTERQIHFLATAVIVLSVVAGLALVFKG